MAREIGATEPIWLEMICNITIESVQASFGARTIVHHGSDLTSYATFAEVFKLKNAT
jgi:hypothetical protein